MRTRILALLGAAALVAPAVAHAQSPLSSMFSCNNPGNRQGSGALIGGLLGGLAGNQIADHDRTAGTLIGGVLGAVAGSAIGCNMSSNEVDRASVATRQALNDNRSHTWSNPNTGVSGRIDIVDTFRRGDVSDRVPDYNGYYNSYRSLADVSFDRSVVRPYDYDMVNATYEASTRVNVRSGPSSNSPILFRLSSGEDFDALARTPNGYLLVGRNGRAVGYVSTDVVRPVGYGSGYQTAGGETCRVFDQTVYRPAYGSTTQRFTACRDYRGEWRIES